jgi:hypothetical protein
VEVFTIANNRVDGVLRSAITMSSVELTNSSTADVTVRSTSEALCAAVRSMASTIVSAVAVRRAKCCAPRPIPLVSQRKDIHCVKPNALRPSLASELASWNVTLLPGVALGEPVT